MARDDSFEFLNAAADELKWRRPPRRPSGSGATVAAVAIGAVLVAGIVAFALSRPNDAAKPQPPTTAPPMAAPLAAKPEPAKSQQALADEASRRDAEEFERKLATIKPRDDGNGIPGNAVPRAQFANAIMGKTAQEVLKLYGAPDKTMQSTDYPDMWTYRRRTYDPLTEKPDFSAFVHFGEDGRVRSVNF